MAFYLFRILRDTAVLYRRAVRCQLGDSESHGTRTIEHFAARWVAPALKAILCEWHPDGFIQRLKNSLYVMMPFVVIESRLTTEEPCLKN